MDAFAVSIAGGISLKCFRVRDGARVGLFFGGFQALMPVVGWIVGGALARYVGLYDHWIVFLILVFIGVKMIYEAIIIKEASNKCDINNLLVLTGLAIATSIDALAVGISYSLLGVDIVKPILWIGSVTFFFCFVGVWLGDKFGGILGSRMEVVGGIILIGIGTKVLLEHLL